jgi:ectoine hydroxylase
MLLSADQLRDFDQQGYLFFPNRFSEEEIALLRDDAEAILKLDRREVWREKTGAPRTAFAAHTFNRRSACWPRIRGSSSRCATRPPPASAHGHKG